MSIQDFYSKLSVAQDDNSSLMMSLRLLSAVEDAAQISGGTGGGTTGDWLAWQSFSESEPVAGV